MALMRVVRTKRAAAVIAGAWVVASAACGPSSSPEAPSLPYRDEPARDGAVWIDMDPAIGVPLKDVDDGWAFVYAMATIRDRVRGVSLGYGNIDDLDQQAAITAELEGLYPPPHLPVSRGAERAEDLARHTEAEDALVARLGYEHVTILALGRLTNVARVIAQHPALIDRIDEVIAIGGRRLEAEPGVGSDHKILPDSNFAADMAAVRVVLESHVPLTLASTELALTIDVTPLDLDELALAGGAARYLADKSRSWVEIWQALLGAPGFSPFDLLAVATVAAPETVRCERLPAAILSLPDQSFRGTGANVPRLAVSAQLDSPFRARFCFATTPDAKHRILDALRSPVGQLRR
jgi:purine nucleosidase